MTTMAWANAPHVGTKDPLGNVKQRSGEASARNHVGRRVVSNRAPRQIEDSLGLKLSRSRKKNRFLT